MQVAIIGSGSWGTALALVLNDNGHKVRCWTIERETIDDIKKNSRNSRYLPDIEIPASIRFTMDLQEALDGAEMIVNAIPSQFVRQVIPKIKPHLGYKNQIWVSVSKGIENKTYLRISEVIKKEGQIPENKIVALSGPSHAEEVARNIPTAVVAACADLDSATIVQDTFMNEYFRVYSSNDIIGVELGGALKNIIALAAGICDGAGLGDNSKAALMTRGLVEMNRLGIQLGAQNNTLAGLSGMGDLIVTCMSKHSRNRHVGEQIGKGRHLQEILDEMVMVAEGVRTTVSAYEIAKNEKVEMPITEQIYRTLFENKKPADALSNLMSRASKIEDW